MLPDMVQTSPQERMSVVEAAAWLGVTEDAVRKRIHRGKIRYEQDPDGRYWVYPTEVDKKQERSAESPQDRLIDNLEEQNRFLRGQLEAEREANRENRRIIAALTQRIPPQLEPSERPPEARETAAEPRSDTEPRSGAGGPSEARERPFTEERPNAARPRSSWWRRLLGS
jgi:excisionase family DNA binding protein